MRSDRALSIFTVVALLAAVHSAEVHADDGDFISTVTVTRTLYGQPMGTPSQSVILESPSSSMSQKDPTVHHTLDLPLPSQFSSLPQIIESLFPSHVPSSSSGNAAQPTGTVSSPMNNREGIPSKSMDNKNHPPQNTNAAPSPRPISAPPQSAYPQMSTSVSKIKEIHHTMMPLPGAPSAVPLVPISNPAANPSQPVPNPSHLVNSPNQPGGPSHPPGAKPTHPGMAVPSGNPANSNMMHSLISANPGMMNGYPSGSPSMQTGGVPVVQVPLGNNNQQIPPSSGSPLLQASSSNAVFNVWPTDLVPPPASSGMSSSARLSSSSSASPSADANNMNKKAGPSNNPISAGSSTQAVGSSLVLAWAMALVAVF